MEFFYVIATFIGFMALIVVNLRGVELTYARNPRLAVVTSVFFPIWLTWAVVEILLFYGKKTVNRYK